MMRDEKQDGFGSDDRQVVNAMLSDLQSPYWEKCRDYIACYLQKSGVSAEFLDDITQNAMISVMRGLKDFRFTCRLIAWLKTIARNRKIDWYRDMARKKPPNGRVDSLTEIEAEEEANASEAVPTTEEKYLGDETSREIRDALEEYARSQRNPERIRFILQCVVFDGVRQKDLAESFHISSARLNQIIREALRSVREELNRCGQL